MDFEMKDQLAFLTVAGSHAFGVATPNSDIDIQGFCIAPARYVLGCTFNFEQSERKYTFEEANILTNGWLLTYANKHNIQNRAEPLDSVIYDVRKFMKLSIDNNPNILSVLFADDSDILYTRCAAMLLRENRDLFLSARVKFTFSGYAFAQLKRIKTHKKWLLNPPDHQPSRTEFGLPDEMRIPRDQYSAVVKLIEDKARAWLLMADDYGLSKEQVSDIHNHIADYLITNELIAKDKELWEHTVEVSENSLGFAADFIKLIKAEKAYKQAKAHWDQYQEWIRNRNPARSDLEAHYGYDCKHAYHLVRLMRMAKEILTTGMVHVKRPDAEELQRIRNGAWTYEYLIEWAEQQQKEIDEIYINKTYVIPHTPNVERINNLCVDMLSVWC